MIYTQSEKQAFSSLFRAIFTEENGFEQQIKFNLINLLPLMGISEYEFKSTVFLNKIQSINILKSMTKEKRIDLLCETIKQAGYINYKSGFDMFNIKKDVAVFDLILETGCFGEDISSQDLNKIDSLDYDSIITVIKYHRSQI